MSQTLLVPSQFEQKLAQSLRDHAVDTIARSGDLDAVAAQLDLARPGLDALLSRRNWTLELAVRVADALRIVDHNTITRLIGNTA